jgi:hypothetical protein
MIISKQLANALINENKAEELGTTTQDGITYYMIINRYDIQRTDHYKID